MRTPREIDALRGETPLKGDREGFRAYFVRRARSSAKEASIMAHDDRDRLQRVRDALHEPRVLAPSMRRRALLGAGTIVTAFASPARRPSRFSPGG